MRSRIVVVDTSILCCLLEIPGKETAGSDEDRWDHFRATTKFQEEENLGSIFVLPIATLIETGNHIANSNGDRYNLARSLVALLSKTVGASSPWAAFSDQEVLWSGENLDKLVDQWPTLAAQRLTIGDATIKNVAEQYALAGYSVFILTADQGLKSYEPAVPLLQPRRRSGGNRQ